ncbi:hypothetical protein BpHYR1_038264 [Brachionus plicatilis]|uniref:Uncharacterized protein n=1 Tax=Brachionus plicatilis TaxID=10195 RepID=A0A3M7RFN7_BRAPC|nr:hypothetical protein BpHYR1_038264 [Brachionus plicatilis]
MPSRFVFRTFLIFYFHYLDEELIKIMIQNSFITFLLRHLTCRLSEPITANWPCGAVAADSIELI